MQTPRTGATSVANPRRVQLDEFPTRPEAAAQKSEAAQQGDGLDPTTTPWPERVANANRIRVK